MFELPACISNKYVLIGGAILAILLLVVVVGFMNKPTTPIAEPEPEPKSHDEPQEPEVQEPVSDDLNQDEQ